MVLFYRKKMGAATTPSLAALLRRTYQSRGTL